MDLASILDISEIYLKSKDDSAKNLIRRLKARPDFSVARAERNKATAVTTNKNSTYFYLLRNIRFGVLILLNTVHFHLVKLQPLALSCRTIIEIVSSRRRPLR